jgi:hypothetical protein
MMCHSRGSWLAWMLMATVAFGGCSVHQRLATQAVSFNLALEKSQNEMLLLNVIRAKDRLPIYLTGMSTLTGNVQTTIGASAGASYTRTKGSTYGSTPSATATLVHAYTPSAMASEMENPTYSLNVLDTQEFTRGFMSPLSKQIFAYYWDQGWPSSLLLYLLVDKVEVTQGGNTTVLKNYPDNNDANLDELAKFASWVETFVATKPHVVSVSTLETIGPPLTAGQLQDLDKLIKVAKEDDLTLEKIPGQDLYQLQRTKTDFRLVCPPQRMARIAEQASCQDDWPATSLSAQEKGPVEEREQVKARINGQRISFVLRSPEYLLYYLGELMRVENRQVAPKIPEVCIQNHFHPLFLAFPEGVCPNALLSAESTQGAYSIPGLDSDQKLDDCKEGALRLRDPGTGPKSGPPVCEAGRSMQVFSLLNQVMSLQKSAKDLPTPTLVRLIGQ